MVRRTSLVILAALFLVLPGCGKKTNNAADSGPRITGGGAVDDSARPKPPSIGGAAAPETK